MNIEEKYRLKYLISLFKNIYKELSPNTDTAYMDTDPEAVELVDDILQKTYGYKDQNERDYLFAAFTKNYYATDGDFDTLGKSIKPITPKLTVFEIEEDEWCSVRITNYYSVETYSEGQAKSLLWNGWLDADDSEQEIIECDDREVEIKEVPPQRQTKEIELEEDLEYWGVNDATKNKTNLGAKK